MLLKNLNNKGTTIIELIISIALLSVVMMFMYRLLADVTFEKESEYFASRNQEQRIEIEQAIYDGIYNCYANNNTITKISNTKYKCDPYLYLDINTTSKKIIVGKTTSNNTTYDLKEKNVTSMNVVIVTNLFPYNYIDKNNNNECSVTMNEVKILIGTDNTYNNANNPKSNNTIDDITFTYEKERKCP